MIIATERLALRPVAPDDHAELHALFTQPGVRRVIFDAETIPAEQTTEIIDKSRALFTERGFGLWVARVTDGNVMVGFGGLWYFRDPPELELLYGIGDAFGKRGYGREIARAIVDHAFASLGMRELRASTHPSHGDSRRVLEALGFVCERRATVGGLDTVFYTKTLPKRGD